MAESRLAIVIDSTGAEKNVRTLSDALAYLSTKGKLASEDLDSLGDTADEQAERLRRLIRQIDPVGAAFEKLSKQRKLLQDAFSKDLLREDDYKHFNSLLDKQQKSLAGIGTQLEKTGMSAAQTANAMRMVPAQFTDIVVSLASGQAPLTVLLQQGGQLKDMFGGIGPAFKGLASYASGLINPFTLAAGAAGTLAAALYSAEGEATALNKSANTLANTSRLSLAELTALARGASALGVSYSSAVDSVGLLSKSINANASVYPKAIKASSDYAWASGQDLTEIIGMFNQLSSDGGKAISDLDDKFNFLTLAQRKQADEALRGGNIAEAQRIAFDGLSGTLETLTKKLNQGATGWDNFWKSVGKGASGGWQTLKEIAGGDYFDNADVRKYLERTRLRDQKTQAGTWTPEDERYYQMLNQASPAVREYAQAQKTIADTTQKAASDKYLKDLSSQVLENADAVTKARNALKAFDTQYQNQPKEIRDAGESDYAARRTQLLKNLKDAQEAASKKPREKAYTEDAGTRMLDQLRQQQQVLLSQADTGDKIGTQAQALIKWEQQLADIKSKQTLTADQKSLLANADIITAQLQQNAAIERQIQSREKLLALDKARADIARTITNRQSQYGAEEFMASGGMSQYEQQQYSQRLSLEQSYNDKITQLRQQRTSATNDIAREEIDQEIELQRQALNTELQNYDDHIARMNAARGSFSAGANRAWREYLDSAANVSAMSQQLFTSAFSGMEDAIVKFATTGKASFKDFATSVISDLARIAARQAIAGIGSSIFGSVLSAGVSAATGSVGSTPSGAYDNAAAGLKFNAKGGVYDSPSLSNYSNGIYNSPQFFAFAKGAGVFAEAGPEAIMPLARGANGSLGVRAIGASSSAPAISIGDINVTISGESQSAEVSNQSTADSARQLQGIILRTVTDWAKREITPGGILYRKA